MRIVLSIAPAEPAANDGNAKKKHKHRGKGNAEKAQPGKAKPRHDKNEHEDASPLAPPPAAPVAVVPPDAVVPAGGIVPADALREEEAEHAVEDKKDHKEHGHRGKGHGKQK